MNILHLSFHYPDEITPRTTPAVRRLIESAGRFADNHCVSFHNGFPEWQERIVSHADHTVVQVRGLPWFIGSRWFLRRCADVVEHAGLEPQRFDLLHAHKLTQEGLIAEHLSERYGIPFCVSLRATDFLLLNFKPYLRGRYLRVLRRAQRIAVIAPWMKQRLRKVYRRAWHELEDKILLIGNVVDGSPRWQESHNDRYVLPMAVNQSQLERKNLFRTLDAVATLKQQGKTLCLDILGDGSGMNIAREAIDQRGLSAQVCLCGYVEHDRMLKTLSGYKALLMCSSPETFGLVYLEALLAGIPLVHSRDMGVDGLFPEFAVGVAASPGSVRSIAQALTAMEERYGHHKAEVHRLQRQGLLREFNSDRYAMRLRDQLYLCPPVNEPVELRAIS